MSDRAALVASVASRPDDDLPKLVFADWLEENGDPERGEFVRLSVAAYRDAAGFPLATDQAKHARLRELFTAHHRRWLQPVYDALGQPLPAFASRPAADRWNLSSLGGIAVSHHIESATPAVVLHAGLVSMLTLNTAALPPSASLATAMASEPLEVLHLRVPCDVAAWRRFAGPHLGRVRSLTIHINAPVPDPARRVAEAVCDPDTFTGLRGVTVTPEPADGRDTPYSVMFDTLRASALRHQLTTLTVYDLPGGVHLLRRDDHGFDALHELTVGIRGLRGGTFTGDVSDWFRERLTRLVIDPTRESGLDWLTRGKPWERLAKLFLSGTAVGDAGAEALAVADTLPALRELRLNRAGITDRGAAALAASPLVTGLDALFVDGNRIGDDGARRLASALDRGLGYLSLDMSEPKLPADTVADLTARYGRRISVG